MIKLFIVVCSLMVVTGAKGQTTAPKEAYDFSRLKPVALPRPNSGAFSYEQAGKRKSEIYNLQLTPKYFGWKSPTAGGAVHINKNDEIEVYKFAVGVYLHGNDTAGIFYGEAAKDTFIVVKNTKELLYNIGDVGDSNPLSVLITAEISLDRSEAIKRLMKELWVPGVQIYYLTKNE